MSVSSLADQIGYASKVQTDKLATAYVQAAFRQPSKDEKEQVQSAPVVPAGWDDIPIYDFRSRLLFRDKVGKLPDGTKVTVRTAGNALLSAPVVSTNVGPFFDIHDAMGKALQVAREHDLVPIEGEKSLICYSYPKLGLLCRRRDNGAEYVIDLGDLSIVDVGATSQLHTTEGLMTWSPYDQIAPETVDSATGSWKEISDRLSGDVTSGPLTAAVTRPAQVQQQTLKLQLRGQETNVFCAVAVAQMILDFYGIQRTQQQIALAMHTGAKGTEPSDEVAGFEALSGHTLTATLEEKPTFEDARNEIVQARPLKSGVPGHARTIGGYKVDDQQLLYIYDPWPSNKGSIYWESYAMKKESNYIYVKK